MLNYAAGSSVVGYNLTKSLRFRASASAYLNRTPASTSNRKTWTLSAWVKRGAMPNSRMGIFTAASGGYWILEFDANNALTVYDSFAAGALTTTPVYRDPSSWYHIVVAEDTTQATASNRTKIYVNGVQITAFSVTNYTPQNTDTAVNAASVPHQFGTELAAGVGYYFDGYMTEVNFIDGQALTPASFGETNALTGVWQPAPYTGTYGTNGFYLKFTDNSTAAALGTDFSGNSNTWTVNNVSLTAGVTYDSMTDVPTLTNATTANYAVLNNISNLATSSTITNGNLQVVTVSSGDCSIPATIGMKGSEKYYAEFVWTASGSTAMLGIIPATYASGTAPGYNSNSAGYRSDGLLRNSGASTSSWGATWVQNDVMAIAFDAGAGTIEFYKNNVKQGSTLTGFTTDTYFFAVGEDAGAASATWVANFGQRPFAYTPPTGFVALNTFNLPTSTIVKGNTVMDATLYTGTGASLSVTNAAGFQPDLVWVKSRSAATDHAWYDSVRGVQNQLESNTTTAETAEATGLTAFGSGGFTVGALAQMNTSAATYVGWQWQAGQGSSSSNTNGSITSQVSVNAAAGFSVVTYTGTGANATVGHGLGVEPKMVIVKRRNSTGDWCVWNSSVTTLGGSDRVVFLNTTDGTTSAPTVFNSSAPTSSIINIGTNGATNASGGTYVAYCWSEIDGFSKFGSYVGNSNADGPFIYLGFRPKFVMFKGISFANNWYIVDSSTNTINVAGAGLIPNASTAETATSTTENAVDFLSNGFKLRNNAASVAFNNSSGQTFIYAAFAENPFKNSLAR